MCMTASPMVCAQLPCLLHIQQARGTPEEGSSELLTCVCKAEGAEEAAELCDAVEASCDLHIPQSVDSEQGQHQFSTSNRLGCAIHSMSSCTERHSWH